MESEKWYLIGALWGDPCFGHYNDIYLLGVYGEKEFCDIFAEKLRRLYRLRTYVYFTKQQGCYRGCASGKSDVLRCAFEELNSFGPFGKHVWRVPKELFEESALARKFVLMGYSDAEGCCNMRAHTYHRRVKWSSVNKVGLSQVRNLLNEFSISTSKLTSSCGNGGKFKSSYPCWDLTIENCTSLARFYRLIGFGMRSKQTKLLNMLLSYKQSKEINVITKELFWSPVV